MRADQRILAFLAAHADRSYTPAQIAHYLRLKERTVLKHLIALCRADAIHEE